MTNLLTATVTQQSLADLYHNAPHHQLNDQELALWHDYVQTRFREETAGIEIVYVKYQAYNRVAELLHDLYHFRQILVSEQHNNDPVLPGELNLRYRAAHDMVHARTLSEFDWAGELDVARTALSEAADQPLIQQLIFSETVLQAAHALSYGEFRSDQPFVPVERYVIEQLLDGAIR